HWRKVIPSRANCVLRARRMAWDVVQTQYPILLSQSYSSTFLLRARQRRLWGPSIRPPSDSILGMAAIARQADSMPSIARITNSGPGESDSAGSAPVTTGRHNRNDPLNRIVGVDRSRDRHGLLMMRSFRFPSLSSRE